MLQLNCKILQQRLDMFSLCFHWCNIGPQQCSKGQIAVGVSEGQGWGFYVLPRSVGMRRSTLALLIGYLPAGTQSNSVLAAKQELRKQRRLLCSSQQEQWSCGVAGWRNEGATCSPQLNTLWRRERVFLLYTETAMIFTALLRTKWPQCCLGINKDVNTNGSNNTSCAEISVFYNTHNCLNNVSPNPLPALFYSKCRAVIQAKDQQCKSQKYKAFHTSTALCWSKCPKFG